MAPLRGHQASGTRRLNGHYQNGDGEKLMWDFDLINAIRGTDTIPQEMDNLQRYTNRWRPIRINKAVQLAGPIPENTWWKVVITLDYDANILLRLGFPTLVVYEDLDIPNIGSTYTPAKIILKYPRVAAPVVATTFISVEDDLIWGTAGWGGERNTFHGDTDALIDKRTRYHFVTWEDNGTREALATDSNTLTYYLFRWTNFDPSDYSTQYYPFKLTGDEESITNTYISGIAEIQNENYVDENPIDYNVNIKIYKTTRQIVKKNALYGLT